MVSISYQTYQNNKERKKPQKLAKNNESNN
jgi:hypothetical protein